MVRENLRYRVFDGRCKESIRILKNTINRIVSLRKKGYNDWVILDLEKSHFTNIDEDMWFKIWEPLRLIRTDTPIGNRKEKPARIDFEGWRIIPIFKNAQFHCKALFSSSRFPAYTDFSGVKFMEFANFNTSHFGELTTFKSAEFRKHADFEWSHFGSNVNFQRIKIFSNIDFSHASFSDKASFYKTEIYPYRYIILSKNTKNKFKEREIGEIVKISDKISEVYRKIITKHYETKFKIHRVYKNIKFDNTIFGRGFDFEVLIKIHESLTLILLKDWDPKDEDYKDGDFDELNPEKYSTLEEYLKESWIRRGNIITFGGISRILLSFSHIQTIDNFNINISVDDDLDSKILHIFDDIKHNTSINCFKKYTFWAKNKLETFIDIVNSILGHGRIELIRNESIKYATFHLNLVKNSLEGNLTIIPGIGNYDNFIFDKNRIHSSVYLEIRSKVRV